MRKPEIAVIGTPTVHSLIALVQARQLSHHDESDAKCLSLEASSSLYIDPTKDWRKLSSGLFLRSSISQRRNLSLSLQQELLSHALISTRRCLRSFTFDLVSAESSQYSQTFAHYRPSSICSDSGQDQGSRLSTHLHCVASKTGWIFICTASSNAPSFRLVQTPWRPYTLDSQGI